jgi:hypothetical protein
MSPALAQAITRPLFEAPMTLVPLARPRRSWRDRLLALLSLVHARRRRRGASAGV